MTIKVKLIAQQLLCMLPGVLKIPANQLLFGAVIGNHVEIGFGAFLVFETLTTGDDCRISPLLPVIAQLRIGRLRPSLDLCPGPAFTGLGALNRPAHAIP